MCGIAGIFSLKGASPQREVLSRMARAMQHRGPDDEGFHVDGPLGFAFRRLSIIDVGGGHQPLTSTDGRYTIVFNGEIYNFQPIREELETFGAEFRTNSDTEVIVNAYAQWGSAALSRFNGMFALAIWDKLEHRLFLARDRFGKKPLHFARAGDEFVFASEIKTLFQHPAVPRAVDRARIPQLLAYRYVPGAETLFRGIEVLPAAHHLTIGRESNPDPMPYWDYDFSPTNSADLIRDPRQAEARLEELLLDSTRLRMISEVPFGAFLSGGIDSSVVVAMMSRLHPEPLKTFSVGFETGFSEASHARQVADLFKTDHHEVTVTSDDLMRSIPAALNARESPISEPSDIPIFLLSKLARSKVTVVLSGEGSDEIFAGYPKYAFEKRLGTWLGSARVFAGWSARKLPYRMRRAQLAMECISLPDKFDRHACWFGGFDPSDRDALLSPELRNATGEIHAFARAALDGRNFPSAMEEMLYLDTRHWLPANLLLRGDRMTMANSLELRCPFLDYRLVEFAARDLPAGQKVHGFSGKWLLKCLAEKLLPREIVHRKKWGFKVPIGGWFRGPLRQTLADVLLSPEALARGYFNEMRLKGIIELHASGRMNLEKQLWILFQLELWHRMFIDRTLDLSTSLTSPPSLFPLTT